MSGSYGITTQSWLSAPIQTPGSNKTKRGKKPDLVILPIFEQLASFAEDATWHEVLLKCSKGSFPSQVSVEGGMLVHRKNNRVKRLPLGTPTPELYSEVKSFLNTWAGVFSPEDREAEEEAQREHTKNIPQTWGQVKRKVAREELISRYIQRISAQLQLNSVEKQRLQGVISAGLLSKLFSSSDFTLVSGELMEIKGILFDPKTRSFSIESWRKPQRVESRTTRVARDNAAIKEWKSYIHSLQLHNKHYQSPLISGRSELFEPAPESKSVDSTTMTER